MRTLDRGVVCTVRRPSRVHGVSEGYCGTTGRCSGGVILSRSGLGGLNML